MKPFHFKHFSIVQGNSALKVGTDSMILGSLCDFSDKQNILDIGAGTGVLSLMVAQSFHPEKITSVEIDESAFIDLSENLKNSPFDSTLIPVCGNILDQQFPKKFDGIITNPPFFEHSTKNPGKEKTTARHTDSLSFADLFSFVSGNLSKSGKFWIIIPHEVREKLIILAEQHRLFISDHILIEGKPGKAVRSVMCFGFSEREIKISTLVVRNEDGSYSDRYISLTTEFHGVKL